MDLTTTMLKDDSIKQLLKMKQSQLNALLEATKAINDNVSAESLYQLYKYSLREQTHITEIALFMYDQTWRRVICDCANKEVNIPAQAYLENYHAAKELNDDEQKVFSGFQYIVPVYHKQHPLAIALLGKIHTANTEILDSVLTFAQIFTNIITVAVENKRLFRKEVEKRQLDKELELASKVQGMLIPKKLPKNTLYEFGGLYMPYRGIGGDYYDVIHINKDEFVFCIGDISGKGVAAALVMANLQAYLNATLGLGYSKETFVKNLNRKIYSITNGENFITLFIGKYNIITRELEYLNAGHIPPILVHNNKIKSLTVGCTMLGAFEELPKIEFDKITIQPDSTIVCVTDGLTELEDTDGEQFGLQRLLDFSLKNYHSGPDIFNKILFDYLCKFKGNTLFNDDVSVLTAKFL